MKIKRFRLVPGYFRDNFKSYNGMFWVCGGLEILAGLMWISFAVYQRHKASRIHFALRRGFRSSSYSVDEAHVLRIVHSTRSIFCCRNLEKTNASRNLKWKPMLNRKRELCYQLPYESLRCSQIAPSAYNLHKRI